MTMQNLSRRKRTASGNRLSVCQWLLSVIYIFFLFRMLGSGGRLHSEHSPSQLRDVIRGGGRRRANASRSPRGPRCVVRWPVHSRQLSRHFFQIPQLWGRWNWWWVEALNHSAHPARRTKIIVYLQHKIPWH